MKYVYTKYIVCNGVERYYRYSKSTYDTLWKRDEHHRESYLDYEVYSRTEGIWLKTNTGHISDKEYVITEKELQRILITEELSK